jgi:CheY-like chemotaxis protein
MDKRKTILIVDDEPDSVEFVKAIISELGDFSLISASDGKSGLEKAKAELPDLIILDVMMPEKDGFSVFYDLRRSSETENIPVIMLTGVSEKTGIKFSEKEMGEFLGKEPEAFIDKPVDPEKLQEAVKRILGL